MASLKIPVTELNESSMKHAFIPTDGCAILDTLLVEDSSLALVKEICGSDVCYSFFNMTDGSPIDKDARFRSENGKKSTLKVDDNFEIISEIIVDENSGFEIVAESLVKNGKIVYNNQRERFTKDKPISIFKMYSNNLNLTTQQEAVLNELLNKFRLSDVNGKATLLHGLFRREWRSRCELGEPNPERFLARDLYTEFSKSSDFLPALRAMLQQEEKINFISAEDLYKKIVEHYEDKP